MRVQPGAPSDYLAPPLLAELLQQVSAAGRAVDLLRMLRCLETDEQTLPPQALAPVSPSTLTQKQTRSLILTAGKYVTQIPTNTCTLTCGATPLLRDSQELHRLSSYQSIMYHCTTGSRTEP
jgi:hypothetical protein